MTISAAQLHGLVVVQTDDVYLLLDGRRRVGMIDLEAGEYTAWVYFYDRRTGITVPRFAGRFGSLAEAAAAVNAGRPERLAWA